ncbi:MAG: hypothetical protein KatS3mg110_0545 [Pirellulaceae bacterium]|nr:MAG: hypothetical protein KatS3mg110_0545 [Pirellulaceae bacterium]
MKNPLSQRWGFAGPPRVAKGRRQGPTIPSRTAGSGFTVVEALVAMALAGLVASSLLLSAYTGATGALESYETLVASAIAEQLMAEITGQPYREKGQSAYQWPLGPETNDGSPVRPGARSHFDDMDDYAGYRAPVVDRWGFALGTQDGAGGQRDPAFRMPEKFFEGWTVSVSVAYVAEGAWDTDLAPGSTSDYRSVTIVINKSIGGRTRELARRRQIIGFVPGP